MNEYEPLSHSYESEDLGVEVIDGEPYKKIRITLRPGDYKIFGEPETHKVGFEYLSEIEDCGYLLINGEPVPLMPGEQRFFDVPVQWSLKRMHYESKPITLILYRSVLPIENNPKA